jgi:putative FmdB family regulatory protein
MPIYTYQCDNCGVRFERHQHFDDPVLTRCPECSKKTLRKIYTPVGIVFKGSGFFATDHRSPSGKRANGSAPTGGETVKTGGEEKSASKGESPSKTETSAKDS